MSTSVDKALQAITILAEAPMTGSELARRLDIHRSTASRLVRTLEEHRFVRRGPDGLLHLGSFLATLPQAGLRRTEVTDTARPHLETLGEMFGHTIHLAGVEAGEIRYWDKVESRQVIRMYSTIGAPAPAHATGVGKAILAQLPERARDRLIGPDPLKRFTEHTHGDRESLRKDLGDIAERGWSLDAAEHEDFIHCIAAPIFDGRGEVVAAVSITAPQFIVSRDELIAMAPELTRVARDISDDMGERT